jgi:hypothetical protein
MSSTRTDIRSVRSHLYICKLVTKEMCYCSVALRALLRAVEHAEHVLLCALCLVPQITEQPFPASGIQSRDS